MIEIINPSYKQTTTSYGNREYRNYIQRCVARIEPHMMKYTYASKEYNISVPWIYFIFKQTLSIHNIDYGLNSSKEHWQVTEKKTFDSVFFSANTLDDCFAFKAPVSNYSGESLCFSGISDYRQCSFEESELQLQEFATFNELNLKNNINLIYSEFINSKGNNDYRFMQQVSCMPSLKWLLHKMNKKIDSWPKFFLSWQKLGELSLDFWPNNNQEIFNSLDVNNIFYNNNDLYFKLHNRTVKDVICIE